MADYFLTENLLLLSKTSNFAQLVVFIFVYHCIVLSILYKK